MPILTSGTLINESSLGSLLMFKNVKAPRIPLPHVLSSNFSSQRSFSCSFTLRQAQVPQTTGENKKGHSLEDHVRVSHPGRASHRPSMPWDRTTLTQLRFQPRLPPTVQVLW